MVFVFHEEFKMVLLPLANVVVLFTLNVPLTVKSIAAKPFTSVKFPPAPTVNTPAVCTSKSLAATAVLTVIVCEFLI